MLKLIETYGNIKSVKEVNNEENKIKKVGKNSFEDNNVGVINVIISRSERFNVICYEQNSVINNSNFECQYFN